MQTRSLFPALLAGLLAVGCSTAAAQDQPEPAHTLEDEQAGEHQHDTDAVRARIADTQVEFVRRRAALEVVRAELARGEADLADEQTRLRQRTSEIEDALRKTSAALEDARESGMGDASPAVTTYRKGLERLRQELVDVEERRERGRADLVTLQHTLREREMQVEQMAQHIETMRGHLRGLQREAAAADPLRAGPRRRGQMTAEERAEIDRLRALGYVGGGAGGRRGPRGAPDAPFRRGGGADAVPERLERLERAVDDLRRLFEEHGVPQERRERGMAEMERRRAGLAGGGGGGGRRGWAELAEAFGARRGTNPPPDAEAVRARAEEMRVMLERTRAENEALRSQMDAMHAQMREMQAALEKFRAEAKRANDAEHEHVREEREGGGERR